MICRRRNGLCSAVLFYVIIDSVRITRKLLLPLHRKSNNMVVQK